VGNPRSLGIGLGEDTGLLITHGNNMEAIGSGLVILVDGRNIKDTNITEVEMGAPISIKNLIVHVMSQYDQYDLEKHEMTIHTVKDMPRVPSQMSRSHGQVDDDE
jgi:cyanophycinase